MRPKRIKSQETALYYHLVSRTVGQEFLLDEKEKSNLFDIIKKYSQLFFVDVIGYCLMSNHFHLVVRMNPGHMFSDENILERLKRFYGKKGTPKSPGYKRLRERFSDISQFVKAFKQTFSYHYNRGRARQGHFWSERFKSNVIESGESLMNCLGYIDLNPVRAGIVTIPEDYRWCGLNYRAIRGNPGNFLSFAGVFDDDSQKKIKENLRIYRQFVYHAGGIQKENKGNIPAELIALEEKRGFKLPRMKVFCERVRHLTDGLVLGSKDFVNSAHERFGSDRFFKRDTRACKTDITESIHTIHALRPTPAQPDPVPAGVGPPSSMLADAPPVN